MLAGARALAGARYRAREIERRTSANLSFEVWRWYVNRHEPACGGMPQLDVLQTFSFPSLPPQTKYRTAVRFTIMWGRVWGRFFADPDKGIDIKSLF